MKKMALVPADMTLQMQQQPYSPLAPAYNQLSVLDQQMKSVLENSTLSPEQKLQLYYNSLRRFGEIQNSEIRVPVPVRIQPETERVEEAPKEENTLPIPDSDLLSRIPKNKRRGAKLLLDYIRKNPDVRWNAANELIYRGQRIPKSNIYDLLRDFSEDSQKNQKSPAGWRELQEALSMQNLPRGAIGNRTHQELLYSPETSVLSLDEEEDDFPRSKRKKLRALKKKPDYGQGDHMIPWETLPRTSSSSSSNIYKSLGKLRTEPPPVPTRQSRRLQAGRPKIPWDSL